MFPARFNNANPTTFERHNAPYNHVTDDYFYDIEVTKNNSRTVATAIFQIGL